MLATILIQAVLGTVLIFAVGGIVAVALGRRRA